MTESTPSTPHSGDIARAEEHKQQPAGAYCVLTRIDDATYRQLGKFSYPIFPQFLYWLYRDGPREDRLNIAQYYAGMRSLFGKPGYIYDDWKGSFSFSFKVDVFRNENIHPYVLNIMHYRGSIEFGFRKVITNPQGHDISSMQAYHKPFDDEFSGQDMKIVESYIYGFLQGYIGIVQKNSCLDAPDFILLSDSNGIVSGYIEGKFFERHIEDPDDFEAQKAEFQSLIDNPIENWADDDDKPRVLTIKLERKELAETIGPHEPPQSS